MSDLHERHSFHGKPAKTNQTVSLRQTIQSRNLCLHLVEGQLYNFSSSGAATSLNAPLSSVCTARFFAVQHNYL